MFSVYINAYKDAEFSSFFFILESHAIRMMQSKDEICFQIPEGLNSADGLLLDRTGEESGDRFFSAVRTCDKAATAAALCDPWLSPDVLGGVGLDPEDELNVEFKAANAEALCVGPPWFVPLDLSWFCSSIRYQFSVTRKKEYITIDRNLFNAFM